MELIPFASVVSCFLLIEIAGEIMSADTMILCMCVIFSIVVTNYIVFLMVHKYTGMAEKRLEEEMIYQEIAYNNEYYQDVEKYQEQIQDIKHDMKNKLAVLYDGVERGEREFVRDTLAEMLGDIRLAEDIIYSANPGLNSLIKVKVAKAREKGIEMTVKAFVPKRMSISFGDMGVIYGNLIDNAIEASMKMQREKRFVDVETKYQDGKLLIVVSNSKNMESNPAFATTKENKRKHGRGIRSVRR
uniref:sensor histidine kinase n=1 Tax=Coprococcus sp. TaxID=2049024 RepID=UPI004029FA75